MSIVTEDNNSRYNVPVQISQRINEITGKINALEPTHREDPSLVFLEKL